MKDFTISAWLYVGLLFATCCAMLWMAWDEVAGG